MTPEEMAKMFDVVDVEAAFDAETSDYSITATDATVRSFEDKCEDFQVVLEDCPAPRHEKATDTDSDEDLIHTAIAKAKMDTPKPTTEPEEEEEIPGDMGDLFSEADEEEVIAEVASDIENFGKELDETDVIATVPETVTETKTKTKTKKTTNEVVETETEIEIEPETEHPIETEQETEPEPVNKIPDDVPDENPLGLLGSDLKAYREIQQKFKKFNLYDGSRSYRDFYRAKVQTLKGLLTRFPFLDLRDLDEEIENIDLDHFIGEHVTISADLIRVKIDNCYRARARVCALLTGVLGQYYAWERCAELLKSKLWKDHDMKGAHRRDGLTMEHMADIEMYVADLKGYIEAAKHADNVLKAAADSLSRQLSCIQLREATGFTQNMEGKVKNQLRSTPPDRIEQTPALDGWDEISEGEVILAPERTGTASTVDFGASDDLAELG